MKKIVILGGGYGGVHAASILDKKLRKNRDIEITLIDKNPFHTLMTELHEVAGGRAEPESVMVSYKKIFGGTSVRLITDEIRTIDFQEQKLISATATYNYDYCIVGAGAEPDYYDVPGAREYTLPLCSFDQAMRIRQHVEQMFRLAAAEPDPVKRQEMLTFIVVGGGFTGVEMAGELLEWKKTLCARYGISLCDVRVIIIEALDTVLSILPQNLQQKVSRFFVKKGGELFTGSPITEVTPDSVTIKNQTNIRARTVIWTAGVQGCEFGANLALKKGKAVYRNYPASPEMAQDDDRYRCAEDGKYVKGKLGRLLVNDYMEASGYKNVYVIGDLAWFEHKGKAVPQIVETALQSAETAAHSILADITGKKKKSFQPDYHGLLVSVGSRYAVAHVMKMRMSGFMAMAMKHLVNLHYLFSLAGLNVCWDYVRHHFLDVKDNRSLIGGHASAKVRTYWVVVLRLFLGVMWLVEGTTKVMDGWLDPSRIYIVNTSVVSNVNSSSPEQADAVTASTPGTETAAQAQADANTAATPAGEYTADAQAETGTDAVSSATAAAAPQAQRPLLEKPLGIYLWFQENFIAKAPYMFQATVVIAELLIGLALIAGLFTFLASAGSIGLCLMFIVSAMASKEIFWYMISAIVLLGGGGRGFGLDYWVMPWLQKWWNKTKLARRTYLYLGEPEEK